MSYSIAMLSVHTSPLDMPGRTRDAGGMNVYIHQLARELGQSQLSIDIFTRRTNENTPQIVPISPRVRVIHISAGPSTPIHKDELYRYLPSKSRNFVRGRASNMTSCTVITGSREWSLCNWHSAGTFRTSRCSTR